MILNYRVERESEHVKGGSHAMRRQKILTIRNFIHDPRTQTTHNLSRTKRIA